MGLALGQVTVRRRSRQKKRLAGDWDHFAADMLDCLGVQADASPATFGKTSDSGAPVFEEYVFFGLDQEELLKGDDAEFGNLETKYQVENESLRSALKIMGSDETTEITRVDLAIMATNKAFMGHPSTEHFLDGLWARPSSNGKFVDMYSRTSPRYVTVAFQIPEIGILTKFPSDSSSVLTSWAIWSSCLCIQLSLLRFHTKVLEPPLCRAYWRRCFGPGCLSSWWTRHSRRVDERGAAMTPHPTSF
jgi:hypothetical protein